MLGKGAVWNLQYLNFQIVKTLINKVPIIPIKTIVPIIKSKFAPKHFIKNKNHIAESFLINNPMD